MTIWEESLLIKPPEDILKYTCYNCSISNNDDPENPNRTRLVPFPSYPILRKNRILVISEFASMDSLVYKNTNPLFGNTWKILERVFFYLGLQPDDFSYTPLIRCWKNATTLVSNESYEKCRDYINLFISLTDAPLVISLGSVVSKFVFPQNFTHKHDGKLHSIDQLRSSWINEPPESIFSIPGVPTEHPQSIRLVRCNSQAKFRSLCVDFMRSIAFASNFVPEYKKRVHTMNSSLYVKDYEEIKKRFEKESQDIKDKLKNNGINLGDKNENS